VRAYGVTLSIGVDTSSSSRGAVRRFHFESRDPAVPVFFTEVASSFRIELPAELARRADAEGRNCTKPFRRGWSRRAPRRFVRRFVPTSASPTSLGSTLPTRLFPPSRRKRAVAYSDRALLGVSVLVLERHSADRSMPGRITAAATRSSGSRRRDMRTLASACSSNAEYLADSSE